MIIEEQNINGAVLVGVHEKRLTASVSAEFKQAMGDVIDKGCPHLVVDFSGVEFMDSSGLGALVAVRKMVDSEGSLKLCGINEQVMSLFKLTRMTQIFDIFDDTDQALAA